MHVMFFSLLFIVAVVGTMVLFVFWLVVTIIRMVGRLLIGQKVAPSAIPQHPHPPGTVRMCGRISCRALNPLEARFGRQCGQRLEHPQNVAVRRVAMF
jgi:hypothetical protein